MHLRHTRLNKRRRRGRRRGRRRRTKRGHVYLSLAVEIDRRDEVELTKRLPHSCQQDLEDTLFVGELNLGLRRVDINIDSLGCDVEIDEIGGSLVSKKHSLIGGHHRLMKIRVLHVSAVDEEILGQTLTCCFRLTHKTEDIHHLSVGLHIHQLSAEHLSRRTLKDLLYALLIRPGSEVKKHLIIAHESEMDRRINQHYPIEVLQQVPELCLVGLEEASARRHVEEEVLHFYVRTFRALCGLLSYHIAPRYL